jgi:hypothetical protein
MHVQHTSRLSLLKRLGAQGNSCFALAALNSNSICVFMIAKRVICAVLRLLSVAQAGCPCIAMALELRVRHSASTGTTQGSITGHFRAVSVVRLCVCWPERRQEAAEVPSWFAA